MADKIINYNPIDYKHLEFLPRLSLFISKNDDVNLIFEFLWFGIKVQL